jgi:hypothetical protein
VKIATKGSTARPQNKPQLSLTYLRFFYFWQLYNLWPAQPKRTIAPPATLTAGVFCRQATGTLRTFEPYESLKRFRAGGNYTNGKWMRDSTAVPRLHVKKRGRVVDQRKEFAALSSLHEGATAERIAKKAKLFNVSLQKHRALRLTLGLLSLCPTLTDLEARIALANHIKTAATSHHLAIWVTKL